LNLKNFARKISGQFAPVLGGQFNRFVQLDHPCSALVPFNYEDIDAEFWLDDCHLNEQGERAKALLLLPTVVKKINSNLHDSN
jgi:hypothetical protein